MAALFDRAAVNKYSGAPGMFRPWFRAFRDVAECSAPMSQEQELKIARSLLDGTARTVADDIEPARLRPRPRGRR
jgi:hypothetical protein